MTSSHSNALDDAPTARGRRGAVIAALAAAAVVAMLVWPWILAEQDRFSQKSYDHDRFHLPLVRTFAEQWPAVDLSDYPSATGPGFHLVLATLAQAFGAGETTLQFLGSLFAIGLTATVAWRLARWSRSATDGLLLALPLGLSPYLLGNAIWLMTDNLSLWLLAAAILGAVFSSATPRRLAGRGLLAAAACVVRQINLWVLAPIAVGGWLAARSSDTGDALESRRWMVRTLLATAVACLPAVAVVAGFAWLWGGLTPPSFQEYHAVSVQPAAVPYGLTLFAAYGAPLWLAIFVARGDRGVVPRWLVVLASFGWAAFLIAGNSEAGLEVGRNGGWLWTLVSKMPAPGGVSVVLAIGSVIGVVLLVQLVALAAARGRLAGAIVASVAMAAFLVAHAANKQLFQRYFDPPVLLFLAIFAALAWPRGAAGAPSAGKDARTLWLVSLAAMAAMQLAFATVTLFVPLMQN
ncbi:MAG: hypothetical protein ACO4CI_12225 [Phycisphaerales bacterium]